MAFNAMDGMLARDFHQKSNLGAYLNELSDVISDAFLYLPFAYVRGFDPLSIGAVIVLSVTSELAGTVAPMTGSEPPLRRAHGQERSRAGVRGDGFLAWRRMGNCILGVDTVSQAGLFSCWRSQSSIGFETDWRKLQTPKR